jgi:hypothetical protein
METTCCYERRRDALLAEVRISPVAKAQSWRFFALPELHYFLVSHPTWTRNILVLVPFTKRDDYVAQVYITEPGSGRPDEALFPERSATSTAQVLDILTELSLGDKAKVI